MPLLSSSGGKPLVPTGGQKMPSHTPEERKRRRRGMRGAQAVSSSSDKPKEIRMSSIAKQPRTAGTRKV